MDIHRYPIAMGKSSTLGSCSFSIGDSWNRTALWCAPKAMMPVAPSPKSSPFLWDPQSWLVYGIGCIPPLYLYHSGGMNIHLVT